MKTASFHLKFMSSLKTSSVGVKTLFVLPLVLSAGILCAQAQDDNTSNKKEEGNRNVMLNASSANGPREIQIGLPSADVNVLENGLPVTYATNPHSVNTTWRSDASLSHVGLLKIAETAITTGNIGYAVNSFTNLGEDGFHGTLNYKTNHFGLNEISLNINGGLKNGWYYSGSIYQDFDPGTFKLKSTPFQDRTQIYKGAITKKYNGNRGSFTAMYKYANSHPVYTYATQSAPFIYVGDGSVKEYGKFKLGTTSYLPVDNNMTYVDMKTGKVCSTDLYDAIENRSSELSLMNTYSWDNGLTWKIVGRYDHAHGALVYQTPMSLLPTKDNSAYSYVYQDAAGAMQRYNGEYVQTRMSCLNAGDIDEILLTSELSKRWATSTLRFGVNEWWYDIDYASKTTMYDQTVPSDGSYPVRVYDASKRDYYFYDYNKNASEYYVGHENKLAFYFTHDWDITPKFNLYYGARGEFQTLSGRNAAVTNANGSYVGRFANYYIGATAPDGTLISPSRISYHWFNYDVTAAATYKLTDNFGLTGDFTYLVQHPKFEAFAPATLPNTDRISVPLGRAGVYYNNAWISLTSLFSYISKTNNNSTLNLQHATANGTEIMAAPLTYDIKTWGWTTDVMAHPLKGLDVHFLFTYQKPTYKKYETSVTFSDGYVGTINATGNIVAEIPQVLIEFDPSYMITKDLKVWTSFRYFGKTYANINEAYYFNGHWETFGGINWQVNKKLALGCSVVNFLNQTGAKGSIAGAELITKDEAKDIKNTLMTGSYLRPFTVEFTATVKF
ncbi:TonB-dependent receptor [uncultured Prevotella sp.]|uniref:TonB-dependent receptor n=1 Tax=uncultured Prevotella sp. TaxID=159272 RepID=UPI002593D4A2|nr:TonB-dependent receptor [uncultured Prevotella sp.]